MNRLLLLGFLAVLGACSVDVSTDAAGPAGAYELQIAANEATQFYLVTGPDSRAAAKVENGVSSLVDPNEARLALGEARAAAADLEPMPEDHNVNIKLPGFELAVSGHEEGQDRAQIAINAGGREVHVDASDGSRTGQALVHVTGASESDARDFINEAEDLSAETKAQMLDALGLTEAPH